MPEGELPDGGLLCEPPGARLLLLLLFQLGQQEAELVCKMSELGIFKVNFRVEKSAAQQPIQSR
jgi:hypothetical protein